MNNLPVPSFQIMDKQHLRDLWERRSADFAAMSVVAVFFTLFFHRALFRGEFLVSGDPLTYSYPLRMTTWSMIRQGILPLWTPYLLSGYPLLSMASIGIGYPLTWGYLFLPGQWAEHLYVLAPYLLAPAFTYAYAREVGRSRAASLLAGFGFGYGGLMFSPLGVNGMLSNAMMWTPLLLIAIERARTHAITSCLLLGTFAYSMSVLTGIGQGFVYAGMLALIYAMHCCLFALSASASTALQRLRPMTVAVSSILFGAGIGAFQIWETLRAARLSVRAGLSYSHFSQGSFPFSLAWRSVIDPIHNVGDVTAYLPPLVLALALMAILINSADERRDPHIYFWITVAVLSFFLILGENTPLYRLVYHIPFINRFRVPSRHSFEWTFALSMMAAYGWDAMQSRLAQPTRLARFRLGLGAGCLAASALVAYGWWRAMSIPPYLEIDLRSEYLLWKAGITFLLLTGVWQAWRISASRWRPILLVSAIGLATFIEPFIGLARWVGMFPERADRFTYLSPVTQFLKQFPPEQHRIYSQIALGNEDHQPSPQIDSLNWTALAGLHNISGYEPLILERYSRALNSAEWNQINRAPFLVQDRSLFEPKSHVLDLLNVTYLVSYSNFGYEPEKPIVKEGIEFSASDFLIDLKLQSSLTLDGAGVEADHLGLVTAMAHSTHIVEGTPVARLSIHTVDGRVIHRDLRAGNDTAEWAHEKADVRAEARHRLAPVFDSRPADEQNSFFSLRYLARIPLGERMRVKWIELSQIVPEISLIVWRASLFDSAAHRSTPLYKFDMRRWKMVYNRDGAIVLQNLRALPRAWLVTKAEAVTDLYAWQQIRGQHDKPFDPRHTALLELEPHKMPALSGRPLAPDSYARIVNYEPNRLVIETRANEQTVLIVSELHYPGWAAQLDGAKVSIHQTNYLLRGVVVPAGTHRIEMRYKAPGARNGAFISLISISLCAAIAIRARRTRQASKVYPL